jgi:hypothetical protein
VSRWQYILSLAAAFAAGGAGVWALTGDEDEPSAPEPGMRLEGEAAERPAGPAPSAEDRLGEEDDRGDGSSRAAVRMSEVWKASRDYVEAIDQRDGALLCRLIVGIDELDLPVRRSSCAESVSGSIGYRDPRGYPVFESAVVSGAPEVELDGDSARATVTVVSEFADRDEPSVEDDVVYFVRRGREWVVAKPSSTLYRAIGTPDVPPDVLEPPG